MRAGVLAGLLRHRHPAAGVPACQTWPGDLGRLSEWRWVDSTIVDFAVSTCVEKMDEKNPAHGGRINAGALPHSDAGALPHSGFLRLVSTGSSCHRRSGPSYPSAWMCITKLPARKPAATKYMYSISSGATVMRS